MQGIITTLLTLSAAAWLGAILFQSTVVAPSVFAFLDTKSATAFLRGLFPRFFRFGLACGGLMLLSILALGVLLDWHSPIPGLTAATSLMIALQVVSLRLVPAINAARDAGELGAARFTRLHALSVGMTLVVLLLGIGVIAVLSAGTRFAGGL